MNIYLGFMLPLHELLGMLCCVKNKSKTNKKYESRIDEIIFVIISCIVY